MLALRSLVNQSNFDYGTHRLNYLTKHIPIGAFANVRGLFCMWNLVDFYDTRLTMGLRLRVSDPSAVESSQRCSMVGRQVGSCKVVGIFILNGIHFSHKQKKSNSL